MEYTVYPHKRRVKPYLGANLSPRALERFWLSVATDLRRNGDAYRGEASRRLAPGSPNFWYHVLFRDWEGDRRAHGFWFVVNDAHAADGKLTLEYVQEGIPVRFRDR